jgi:serine kinase of HPr protein (carbohydrate metabolism regulator)
MFIVKRCVYGETARCRPESSEVQAPALVMNSKPRSTIHASAVLVGARAVLIRGAPGSGKSRLALRLLQAGEAGLFPFVRLVADDRAFVEPAHGRLLAWSAPDLAGLIEVRGLGVRRVPHEPVAVVSLVVDLGVADAERMPQGGERQVTLAGIALPRIAVPETDPWPLLLAALRLAG